MSATFQRFTILLFVTAVSTMMSAAELNVWPEYRRSSWPVFNYPPGYSVNSRSFGGVNGDDEGTLRICILSSPDKDLQIISSNYGFIPDIHRSMGGFDNPRDVLLAGFGGDPFRIRRTQESTFEVFRVTGDSSLKVYFLMNNAEWGQCFEFLEFLFNRGNYEKHAETIEKVIGSFKPSFSNTPKTSSEKHKPPISNGVEHKPVQGAKPNK